TVRRIWKVITGAEDLVQDMFPKLRDKRFPNLPKELAFIQAEEILERYPDLPRKQREARILQDYSPAVFIIGVGWVLKDGYPHEMRAADYDDWVTDTSNETGKDTHGLNGDILVWNHLTKRRHELSSMGIRVTKETLKLQLKLSGQLENLKLPYHRMIMKDQIPLSIGGGIGQGRVQMLLLHKAHFGEVTVTVWPRQLHKVCEKHNIFVLK
ncbi:MAG: aspartate--ammonia ligase, partial [candidate division WOR-3 bacterium]